MPYCLSHEMETVSSTSLACRGLPRLFLVLIFTEKISKQLGERELVNTDNSAILLTLKL